MVKRTLNNLQPEEYRVGAKRGTKRQRTEEFLEKTANYEHTMRTCQFFASHLNMSVEETSQVDDTVGVTSATVVRDQLQRSMLMFEMKHQSDYFRMRNEASEAIRLADAFRTVSSGIEAPSGSPILGLLDLGSETTNSIKKCLSEYAGVPSSSELLDWKNLDSLMQ